MGPNKYFLSKKGHSKIKIFKARRCIVSVRRRTSTNVDVTQRYVDVRWREENVR